MVVGRLSSPTINIQGVLALNVFACVRKGTV